MFCLVRVLEIAVSFDFTFYLELRFSFALSSFVAYVLWRQFLMIFLKENLKESTKIYSIYKYINVKIW